MWRLYSNFLYSPLEKLLPNVIFKNGSLFKLVVYSIFRDFVPLQDKLNTLWDMPEFQHLIHDRGTYLNSSHPFSLDYVELLRSLRPGWYVQRNQCRHRFILDCSSM